MDAWVSGSGGVKSNPNHRVYLTILRRMSPEDRLRKAFELTDLARSLFVHGLRSRFPDLSPEELQSLVRKRLDKCHNRNY
jgi:hypothetical protein